MTEKGQLNTEEPGTPEMQGVSPSLPSVSLPPLKTKVTRQGDPSRKSLATELDKHFTTDWTKPQILPKLPMNLSHGVWISNSCMSFTTWQSFLSSFGVSVTRQREAMVAIWDTLQRSAVENVLCTCRLSLNKPSHLWASQSSAVSLPGSRWQLLLTSLGTLSSNFTKTGSKNPRKVPVPVFTRFLRLLCSFKTLIWSLQPWEQNC